MSEKILYAIITFCAFIAAQLALYVFTYLRDLRLRHCDRIDVARLAAAEVANITRHMEANIKNLSSQLKNSESSRKVDFEKLKLCGENLIALDVSKLYFLEENLMKDLLRLSLYCRNNDLEIEHFIENHFASQKDIDLGMLQLKFRFEGTLKQSKVLQSRLNKFIKSPSSYTSDPVHWRDSMFKNSAALSSLSKSTNKDRLQSTAIPK